MSDVLIQQYLNNLQDLRKVSGTSRESVVREAFKDLLKEWGKQYNLVFVPEYEIETPAKERRYVDGALLHELRVPFGYWEAKDEKDDLDAEIAHKFKRGYPQDNIIFEDSTEAVLIQNRQTAMRCPVDDVKALSHMLGVFFSYERAEISDFRKGVEQFKADLPAVLEALRAMIQKAIEENNTFREASKKFLAHAQEAINPALAEADVREMLIQHVLTEEIFSKVFSEDDFHRQNNVARELYALEETFFTGDVKKRTMKALEPYYAAIRSAAARISSHHEKQAFLKVIYESFYKVYNVKAADRLGVVYTPNEIVRFMVESADWLCDRHFGKNLIDKEVEILDPAAGTGTFICELLEHFRGQPRRLKDKYLNELHANEVAILPYYVANLNIEATYAAITAEYAEFPNLCFVDTLDNVTALRAAKMVQSSVFGGVSEENLERINRQNKRKISVIIGNPPYNANQMNENENNKNREYPEIDKRIKATYIAASTAQKTKLYDMYARFFRWASDRLNENGILAFVSNSSFIDSRTYDGFRKVIAEEFNDIWVVDLKGNARTSGERRRREGGNIFEDKIRVGVAVYFCVKKSGATGCRIHYKAANDYAKADDKLAFLGNAKLRSITMEEIKPDAKHNWINLVENDFDTLIPIATKATKSAKKESQERAIFKLFSLGVVTARDEWVYDLNKHDLETKVKKFVSLYEKDRARWSSSKDVKATADFVDRKIKWTSELESYMKRGSILRFSSERIRSCMYRPYCDTKTYYDHIITHRVYQQDSIFPIAGQWRNQLIALNVGNKPFNVLAANRLIDYHFNGDAICFPLHCYGETGQHHDNITSWALEQFRERYEAKGSKSARSITREDIFHYVYGVLHDPVYREKYALNLKREFPRIPFYEDFWRWADWGKELMELHIGYESVEPFALKRADAPDEKARKAGLSPKPFLKADKTHGIITLDTETTLSGVPAEAWEYKLGNRSALEWILDQHKEKKPKDPTIREKFNTYRFADYKEKVIDLLMRVTTVSVKTVAITEAMKKVAR